MWRLIVFILIFALFLVFIVFNLDNKCDVSFGFKTIKEIPVFLTVFSSFVLGMLFAVPFVRGRKKHSKETSAHTPPAAGKTGKKKGQKEPKNITPDSDTIKRDASSGSADEIKKENSPYGID